MNHRIITTVAFVAAVGAASAAPAEARPTCGESGNSCPATAGADRSASSAFSEPLAALGGRSLAQYLADHFARDRRLGGAAG